MQATMTTELTKWEKRQIKRDWKAKRRFMNPYNRCGLWVLDVMSERRSYALQAYRDAFEYHSNDIRKERMRWYFTWKKSAACMTDYFKHYKSEVIPLP